MKSLAPVLVACALAALPAGASAQRLTRRPVAPEGEVTGLELGLEGRTTVCAGGRLRLLMTVFEVVGQRDLRPAPGAALRVAASYRREAPIAELVADGHGRASLDVPAPEEAEGGTFSVVIEAVSASRVRRRFEVSVSTVDSLAVELVADRSEVPPGGTVGVFGRVLEVCSGRPVPGVAVRVRPSAGPGSAPAAPIRVVTDRGGGFVARLRAPSEPGGLDVSATLEEGRAAASATVRVERRTRPEIWAKAVAERPVVRPSEAVAVELIARWPDGRPFAGAAVIPPADPTASGGEALQVRTDAEGRARFEWRPPGSAPPGRAVVAVGRVRVVRAGTGTAEVPIEVRLASAPLVVGVAAEGGRLAAGLPSRLSVRVSRAEGGPAPEGTPVRLASELFDPAEAVTDRSGVAVLEVTPRVAARPAGPDRCGGSEGAAATVTAGEGASRAESEVCLPFDPEATVRVRPARRVLRRGEVLEVALLRGPSVRRAPLALAIEARQSSALAPIAQQVLGPSESSARFDLPEDLTGEVLIRARALVGREEREVRGGTALVWVEPGAAAASRFEDGPRGLELAAAAGASGLATVLPLAEGEAFATRLRRLGGPFVEAVAGFDDPTPALVAGTLDVRTPVDAAAPATLRGATVEPSPAPADPATLGVLRDPARARARFVEGRLGLLYRAVEHAVAAASAGRMDDVAGRTSGGWVFNRELLEAALDDAELGPEGPRGLGGEPLGLGDLERLDPAFTFDNVARRVTRERLLRILVTLRSFVRERDLDLWSEGRGDPAAWIPALLDHWDEDLGEPLDEGALHDGWGRVIAIRRAPRGSRRIPMLDPLPDGYELVSAGPDGRFGTADDVRDPFARVLPSGGVYAEAVGEDGLLARLQGGELDRAAIGDLGEILGSSAYPLPSSDPQEAEVGTWLLGEGGAGPTRQPRAFERSWIVPGETPWARLDLSTGRAGAPSSLDEEPRRLLAVGLAWAPSGALAVATRELEGGVPVLLDAGLPPRLRAGEPISVRVAVAALPGAPAGLSLEVAGSGVVRAALEEGQSADLDLAPGATAVRWVRLEATGVGEGRAMVRTRAGGRVVRALDALVLADDGGLLRSQVAASLGGGALDLELVVPADAGAGRAELVVTPPSALWQDPALAALRRSDPALLAWARAVATGEVPDDLVAALAQDQERGDAEGCAATLGTACAVVAWSAVPGEDGAPHPARGGAAALLVREGYRLERAARRRDAPPEERAAAMREWGSLLVALATAAGPPAPAVRGRQDEVDRTVAAAAERLRSAMGAHRGDLGVMARAAAALLLLDSEDLRGRAMLEECRGALAEGPRGGRVVAIPVEAGVATAEPLVATAALAIAARQVGDAELADELARGLAARAPTAMALGGEPAFWLLAAAVYGVFGAGEPGAVSVTTPDGGHFPLDLAAGPARLALPLPAPARGGAVRVVTEPGGAVPLVRLEARYPRPPAELGGSPLHAHLEGDPGTAPTAAALELAVRNEGPSRAFRPVVLLSLPALATVGPGALAAIEAAAPVASVEAPDRRGVLRIELAPLEAGAEARVPLPLRWIGSGRVRGLGLAAFEAGRHWELTVTPEVELTIERDDASR